MVKNSTHRHHIEPTQLLLRYDYMNVTLRRISVQFRELPELPAPRQPRPPLVSRVLQVIRLNNSFVIS